MGRDGGLRTGQSAFAAVRIWVGGGVGSGRTGGIGASGRAGMGVG